MPLAQLPLLMVPFLPRLVLLPLLVLLVQS
jgi:hypothetical protein